MPIDDVLPTIETFGGEKDPGEVLTGAEYTALAQAVVDAIGDLGATSGATPGSVRRAVMNVEGGRTGFETFSLEDGPITLADSTGMFIGQGNGSDNELTIPPASSGRFIHGIIGDSLTIRFRDAVIAWSDVELEIEPDGDDYLAVFPAGGVRLRGMSFMGMAAWYVESEEELLRSEFAGNHAGVMRRLGANSYAVVRDELAGGAAPTGSDNFAVGWAIGSRWIYGNDEYVCTGDGVWTSTTAAGGTPPEPKTFVFRASGGGGNVYTSWASLEAAVNAETRAVNKNVLVETDLTINSTANLNGWKFRGAKLAGAFGPQAQVIVAGVTILPGGADQRLVIENLSVIQTGAAAMMVIPDGFKFMLELRESQLIANDGSIFDFAGTTPDVSFYFYDSSLSASLPGVVFSDNASGVYNIDLHGESTLEYLQSETILGQINATIYDASANPSTHPRVNYSDLSKKALASNIRYDDSLVTPALDAGNLQTVIDALKGVVDVPIYVADFSNPSEYTVSGDTNWTITTDTSGPGGARRLILTATVASGLKDRYIVFNPGVVLPDQYTVDFFIGPYSGNAVATQRVMMKPVANWVDSTHFIGAFAQGDNTGGANANNLETMIANGGAPSYASVGAVLPWGPLPVGRMRFHVSKSTSRVVVGVNTLGGRNRIVTTYTTSSSDKIAIYVAHYGQSQAIGDSGYCYGLRVYAGHI